MLSATHIVIVCFYCQFFSFSNGAYSHLGMTFGSCSTRHPPGMKFHNYDHMTMYAMMIIIIQDRLTHVYLLFILLSMPDVDVDKCSKAPTNAPTTFTKAPTTVTKACQFADGTHGTKCAGLDACVGIDWSKIGCGSCNGVKACQFGSGTAYTDKVIVGEKSCNGLLACTIYIHPVVQSGGNAVIGKQSW